MRKLEEKKSKKKRTKLSPIFYMHKKLFYFLSACIALAYSPLFFRRWNFFNSLLPQYFTSSSIKLFITNFQVYTVQIATNACTHTFNCIQSRCVPSNYSILSWNDKINSGNNKKYSCVHIKYSRQPILHFYVYISFFCCVSFFLFIFTSRFFEVSSKPEKIEFF